MKLKYCLLIYYLFLLTVSGCVSQKKFDKVCDPASGLLAASFSYYYDHNEHWPASLDELKSFCSEDVNRCPLFEWDRYSNTHLEILPDGSLKIESHISADPDKPSNSDKLDFALTISKPVK
ncbi:MAG: hypothetical protein JW806_06015 [Sedimentisphaerales bacterium]|nr:hypothetical protein [Sedimentisphaerales bacterium]